MVVVIFSQERIAKSHGSQCGFCTPGIVMSMYTLLRNKPEPQMEDIEDAFQGNTHIPCRDAICSAFITSASPNGMEVHLCLMYFVTDSLLL